jgi:hypothetical protein
LLGAQEIQYRVGEVVDVADLITDPQDVVVHVRKQRSSLGREMATAGALHDPLEHVFGRQGVATQPRELLFEAIELLLHLPLRTGGRIVENLLAENLFLKRLDAVFEAGHDRFVLVDEHVQKSMDEES